MKCMTLWCLICTGSVADPEGVQGGLREPPFETIFRFHGEFPEKSGKNDQ